jgi:hypothetical protein
MESTADAIRRRERDRLRALVDGDQSTADELHASDYQLITPTGRTFSKTDYLGAIATGKLRYHVFESEDESAMEIVTGDDMYAVRYIARIEVELDGQRSDLLRLWHTDIYRRSANSWQAVWSQATLIAPNGDNA